MAGTGEVSTTLLKDSRTCLRASPPTRVEKAILTFGEKYTNPPELNLTDFIILNNFSSYFNSPPLCSPPRMFSFTFSEEMRSLGMTASSGDMLWREPLSIPSSCGFLFSCRSECHELLFFPGAHGA